MINYKLNINKGLWHVNFYVDDVSGKKKRKQLSTGIKAYDNYGRRINKRMADEKAQEMDYITSCFKDLFDSDD